MNGSVIENVTGSRPSSGRFSQPIRWPWKAYATPEPPGSARRRTTRPVRGSPRWSTSPATSSCPSLRGRGRRMSGDLSPLALDRDVGQHRRAVVGRDHERVEMRLLDLVVAGDRVLELVHPLAERAPQLGEPLRPEDEQ